MQVITSRGEVEARTVILYEEALQYLEPAAKDLERLMANMMTVAECWARVDAELSHMDAQAKKLRDDHMLRTEIRSLIRNWKKVEKDFKQYINAVRVVHA